MGISRRLLQQVALGLLGLLPAAPLLSGGPEAVLASEDSAEAASSSAVWNPTPRTPPKKALEAPASGLAKVGQASPSRAAPPFHSRRPVRPPEEDAFAAAASSSPSRPKLFRGASPWQARSAKGRAREADPLLAGAERLSEEGELEDRESDEQRVEEGDSDQDGSTRDGEADQQEEEEDDHSFAKSAALEEAVAADLNNPPSGGDSVDDEFPALSDELRRLRGDGPVSAPELGEESFVWELIHNGGGALVEENVSLESAWDALVQVLARRSFAEGRLLTRPEPRMKKAVEHRGGGIETAALTMCGRRDADEDSLVVYASPEDSRFSVRAIFDGHGGSFVSKFCAENLHRFLKGMSAPTPEALKEVFLRFDAEVLKHSEAFHEGSTGIVVLIQEVRTPRDFLVYGREVLPNSETPPLLRVLEDLERDDNEPVEEVRRVTLGGPEMPAYILTVANVGDSRGTLLHREGGFTPLSADHKPSDPHEKSRVEAAGGFVASPPYSVPRIDNILALSRAFGDGAFKDNERLPPEQQKVVAVPDVRSFYALPGDVLMLACDGVYEPAEVDWVFAAHFVLTLLHELEDDLLEAAVKLAEHAFGSGSGDNISILLSKFGTAESASVHQARTFMVDSNGEVLRDNATPPDTLVGSDSEAELEELKGPMLDVDPKSPLTLK